MARTKQRRTYLPYTCRSHTGLCQTKQEEEGCLRLWSLQNGRLCLTGCMLVYFDTL